ATLELGEDRPLVDAGVDALLQDARRFLLRERDHASDEIAARHGAGMEGHELIEQQHRETPLLLVGFWRGGRNDGWNMWLGSHPRGYTTGPLRRPPRELRGRLWLVHLRVVGPQRGTRPARLRDEVLEDEDRVGTAFEEPAAHALRDGDGLHPGELKRHEERFVLCRDLLTEDRELHANRSELGGFLQDRLQDREC